MGTDKKKILYLMEYPLDLPGGGQESTKTLCEGISADGEFEPVVACPALLSTAADDYGYRVITYSSDENRELSKIRRIINFCRRIVSFGRIIREVSPDLIHVSMSESLITYGFLRVLHPSSRRPFIYTDRGLRTGYRGHSRWCIEHTMKYAEGMITTTHYNAGLWEKEITVPITVIENTISDAFAGFDPQGRVFARKKYNIPESVPVVGFAGRISEEKDWGRVPEVVSAIADSGIRFKVALVMSVYEARDAEIRDSVKRGITEVIGADNLIYMQDLSQKEISDYYYLVDFFIMTSCFESFGKAAVEAMSRKCIVLSTAVGGLPEVIGCPEDMYDMQNLSKLTERIRYFTDSPGAAERERNMFYKRYIDRFMPDKNIERHLKLYRRIIPADI